MEWLDRANASCEEAPALVCKRNRKRIPCTDGLNSAETRPTDDESSIPVLDRLFAYQFPLKYPIFYVAFEFPYLDYSYQVDSRLNPLFVDVTYYARTYMYTYVHTYV